MVVSRAATAATQSGARTSVLSSFLTIRARLEHYATLRQSELRNWAEYFHGRKIHTGSPSSVKFSDSILNILRWLQDTFPALAKDAVVTHTVMRRTPRP